MYGKSPMMKKLIGGQKVLKTEAPELAAAIEASPTRMYGKKSMAKMYGKKSAVKNYKKGYYGA